MGRCRDRHTRQRTWQVQMPWGRHGLRQGGWSDQGPRKQGEGKTWKVSSESGWGTPWGLLQPTVRILDSIRRTVRHSWRLEAREWYFPNCGPERFQVLNYLNIPVKLPASILEPRGAWPVLAFLLVSEPSGAMSRTQASEKITKRGQLCYLLL